MKLLPNSSYGYHNMDRSQHIVTKCLSDEKNQTIFESKVLTNLNHAKLPFNEVELIKAQIEQKVPMVVGFFIL